MAHKDAQHPKQSFGDILDQWEQQSAAPHKKSKTTKSVTKEPEKINPITAWIRIHGVFDKDSVLEESKTDLAEERHRLRYAHPDATLDLHGCTRDEAWRALEDFFEESKNHGFKKILIVHGKGNHCENGCVLKDVTRRFIELCPIAGASGHEKASSGGTGATWVLLKKDPFNVPDR
ncbi:DNA mismatch repair protein MutS [Spirochaetia bacterium]|nr:DNA mismatch repair protein MutS [Spirochaetia bacterium]